VVRIVGEARGGVWCRCVVVVVVVDVWCCDNCTFGRDAAAADNILTWGGK